MPKSSLITSFDVWKPHHRSNASDDLLAELVARQWFSEEMVLLRKLPVDFVLAPEKLIATIAQLQPEVIVCCGMAERRSRLSVESKGQSQTDTIHTSIDVRRLVEGLSITSVSHHAGRFVCNHTYYTVLKYLRDTQSHACCVFVHVPVLQDENRDAIVTDFATILTRLTQ